MEVRSITTKDIEFPKLLKEIDDSPQRSWLLGAKIEDRPRLTVVGSRKISSYGARVVRELVGRVARAGVVIVSGLALGADGLAHEAALDAKGTTIAIMPAGLHAIYPPRNRGLAQRILKNGGTLVSEYDLGVEPQKYHFVARNRIQSGISDAVLIIEAAEKSGTLITAQFAIEQGRTVMAVPGPIFGENHIGTNNLIKDGALAVTCAEDILTALSLNPKAGLKELYKPRSEAERVILSLISSGISKSEELLIRSELPLDSFNTALTMLELAAAIQQTNPGLWDIH